MEGVLRGRISGVVVVRGEVGVIRNRSPSAGGAGLLVGRIIKVHRVDGAFVKVPVYKIRHLHI